MTSLQACPEAAQLALLLRAEERLPAREADLPLLDFGEERLPALPEDGEAL